MSNPFKDAPESSGYSKADEDAIVATLEAMGLKPGASIRTILFSIVQVVDAVSGGGVAHPHHMLYAGENQQGP